MIEEIIKNKKIMMEGFILSHSYLFSVTTFPNLENVERVKISSSLIYISSIIRELIIKILWEIDNKKKAKHTHDILKLYQELNNETKEKIISSWKNVIERQKKLTQETDKIDIKFSSIEEMLKGNEYTIKNFKYSGYFAAKIGQASTPAFYKEMLEYIELKIKK